ncbi:MAG: prolipoprotein diacylglyceryl transferase [Acholeplasmataceae bacterium]|jgi:phosphatidylglycerol:prolipoprotein diacylglycerol transferase
MTTIKQWFFNHITPIKLYGGALLYFMVLVILAVVPQTRVPYNNVAIDLGFVEVAWYAVFILSGLLIAVFWSVDEFKKKGLSVDFLYDALLWTVPIAIVGSRIYYVIFDPNKNYQSIIDIINISRGGLSIHGVVITATLFVLFYTKKKGVNFWLIADIVAVGFLIGQIVGRWGNFMNQEAYGPVIESQFILNILPAFIKDQMFIAGNYHHPTFLYEGLWNLVGLVILINIRRKKLLKIGDLFALYLMWYGLGRGAIIEPLRTGGAEFDALRVFGLPVNIYLSLILFLGGGLLLMFLKNKKLPELPYYAEVGQHD